LCELDRYLFLDSAYVVFCTVWLPEPLGEDVRGIPAMNLFHNLAERYLNGEPTSGNIESNELDEEILLACRTLMRLPDASTARPANARILNEERIGSKRSAYARSALASQPF
jgi:hypothetical protein